MADAAGVSPPVGEGSRFYRPDIDGLRAVAVLAVVLYHYGIGPFPGGFVGVDVFFVISGYLITAIAAGAIDRGGFSFVGFYERRLRRVAPALLAMLLACGAISPFVYLTGDLRFVGAGLFHAALYTSNLLFYGVANDYFAAGTLDLQPVLHTWSLAVEAQFYLVYPWLLMLIASAGWPRRAVLLGLAMLSFVASAWGAVQAPVATFYLLPTRFWELALGGLVALTPRGTAFGHAIPGASWVGLGLILLAALLYGPATPFPGAAALLPCLGAALVLRAGADGRGSRNLVLTSAPVRALGKMSYSLYLWHWPVLVFGRYGHAGEVPLSRRIALLALSGGLAALSWWWIERPFLARAALPTVRRLYAGAAGAIALVAVCGVLIDHAGRGDIPLPALSPRIALLANAEFDMIRTECRPDAMAEAEAFPCRFGAPGRTPTFLLWGNSYARMWAPALDRDARAHGVAGVSVLLSKCPPLLGADLPGMARCRRFNDAALAAIRDTPALSTVVLGADWFTAGEDLKALGATVEALRGLGRRVVVVLAPPQAEFQVPRTLAMAALRGEPPPPPIDRAHARAAQAASIDLIEALRQRYGFTLLDPADWLCDDTHCDIARNGRPLYFDAGHVTASAAREAGALFEPVFQP